MSCRTNQAWADAALGPALRRDGLTGADAALCSRLVYGVLQNQALLTFYLEAFCSPKSRSTCSRLFADILQIGAYQILFLDKSSAPRSIRRWNWPRTTAGAKAAGLVNAVLRRAGRERDALPPIPPEGCGAQPLHPVQPSQVAGETPPGPLGPETEACLAADNNAPLPLTIQVNPPKTTRKS